MSAYHIFDVIVFSLIAFLLLLAIFHGSHTWAKFLWDAYRARLGFLIPAVACLIFVIGFFSVERIVATRDGSANSATDGAPASLANAKQDRSGVLNAVRLLKLDSSASTPGPGGLIGLGAAVMLWVMLGLELNRVLLYEAMQTGRFRRLKNHTVICGLGSIGLQLVKDLRRSKATVVVIEINESNPYLDDARGAGAIVAIRDATDDKSLKHARIQCAKELFVVTGRDTSNSTVIAHAGRIPRTGAGALRCYAHIDSSELVAASNVIDSEDKPKRERDKRVMPEVEFVLPQELAATQLLTVGVREKLPADLSGRTPHFVLFGFGVLGQEIARQIAELIHLGNEKRVRVTVLYETNEQAAEFRSKFPAFAPDLETYRQSNPNPWELPADADLWGSPFHAKRHARSPDLVNPDSSDRPLPVSFVCNADFIALPPEHDVLHDAMSTWSQKSMGGAPTCKLIPFARTNEILSYDAIVRSGQRELAKWIQHGFQSEAKADPERLWSELLAWKRRSNLATAAHSPFKGRLIGKDLTFENVILAADMFKERQDEDVTLSTELRSLLARVEHNRWMGERLMAGWRYANPPMPAHDPADDEDTERATKQRMDGMTRRKERDSIVPCRDLPFEEFQKDLNQQVSLLLAFGLRLNESRATLAIQLR